MQASTKNQIVAIWLLWMAAVILGILTLTPADALFFAGITFLSCACVSLTGRL